MQRCHRASGRQLSDALHQAPAGIRDDQPHTREAPVHQVAQEGRPAGLVLLGPLADAQDLPVALRVHRAGHQQRDVAPLARPGPLHDDPVQVQIGMLAPEGAHLRQANLKVRGGNPLPATTSKGSLDVLGNRRGFI